MNNDKRLQELIRKKTTVNTSPFTEMVVSLHVLYRPEHHVYRVEWAANTMKVLPSQLAEELNELGKWTDEWLAVLDAETEPKWSDSPKETIKQIQRMPEAEFLQILFNQRFSLLQILTWLGGQDESWKNILDERERTALLGATKIRRRMAAALQQYWDDFFQHEWRLIEPWLVKAERDFADKVERNGVQALAQLHPRLFVKEDGLYMQKATLYRFPYEETKKIVVRPSTFVHPHLLIGHKDGIVTVPLDVRVPGLQRQGGVPADLIRMFKTLSDETRLKIVHSLFAQPHCTQQLAQIHQVSEAAISKHLKILMEAKYVTTERRGNYVFYRLVPQEVEMILVYLRQYLEQ